MSQVGVDAGLNTDMVKLRKDDYRGSGRTWKPSCNAIHRSSRQLVLPLQHRLLGLPGHPSRG